MQQIKNHFYYILLFKKTFLVRPCLAKSYFFSLETTKTGLRVCLSNTSLGQKSFYKKST
jgi:hypothetical protein